MTGHKWKDSLIWCVFFTLTVYVIIAFNLISKNQTRTIIISMVKVILNAYNTVNEYFLL